MKNIMLSIKPKYAELILQGQKTIEVRKSCPRELIEWVYLYATAPIKKVVGRFKLRRFIDEIYEEYDWYDEGDISKGFETYNIDCCELEATCLTYDELEEYGKRKPLYLWHIELNDNNESIIEKFVQPKDLKDFNINKAPQSWCYIKEVK